MRKFPALVMLALLLLGGFILQRDSVHAQSARLCGVKAFDYVRGTAGGGRNRDNLGVATGEPGGPGDSGFVSLGQGGSLTIELAPPGLSGDGTPNSDLFIYESGTVAEVVIVVISTDGTTFLPAGASESQASGIDLDALGFGPGTNYRFVSVTDDPSSGPGGRADTAGADVDAVCGSNTNNGAPLAVDDSGAFGVGDPYETNVLANDSDPDGNTLTIESFTPPTDSVGTVTVDENGNATFVPTDPDFEGTVTFTYTIVDGQGGRATATVIFQIGEPPNAEAPVVVDPVIETAPGEPVSGDLNDLIVDPQGDPLEFETITPPSNGTLDLDPGGIFVYDPDDGFTGEDSFEVLATDPNGNSSVAEITVVVDETTDLPGSPPQVVDNEIVTQPDEPLTGDLNDLVVDPDGDPLAFEVVTPPVSGTLDLDPNGVFTYIPRANFIGEDSFEVIVSDPAGNSIVAEIFVVVGDVCALNDEDKANVEAGQAPSEATPIVARPCVGQPGLDDPGPAPQPTDPSNPPAAGDGNDNGGNDMGGNAGGSGSGGSDRGAEESNVVALPGTGTGSGSTTQAMFFLAMFAVLVVAGLATIRRRGQDR